MNNRPCAGSEELRKAANRRHDGRRSSDFKGLPIKKVALYVNRDKGRLLVPWRGVFRVHTEDSRSGRTALRLPVGRVALEPRHRAFRGVVRMRKGTLASPFKPDLQQDSL